MKLNFLPLLALVVCSLSLFSQPYGNEWIKYNQSYYYFPISQDGVFRITQADLLAANFPLSSIDPRNIQLFAHGQEVAIHIEGESDGNFDSSDYIEFYAEKNDGFADAELYVSAILNPQPNYSLINDTIYYYLSWNTSTSNKRLTLENDVNYSGYSAANYVWKESLSAFNSLYYDGKTEISGGTDPAYHETEGWFDTPIALGGVKLKNVLTSNAFAGGPNALAEFTVLGQSNYAQVIKDHHLNVQFAGLTFDTIYEGYQAINKRFSIPASSLTSTNTSFVFRSINDIGASVDRCAISFVKMRYAHTLNLGNSNLYVCEVPNQSGQSKSYLNITNFNANGTTWLMDVTNNKRIVVSSSGSNHQVLIPNAGGDKRCILFSEGNTNSIASLKPVSSSGLFTNFLFEEKPNGFVIISSPELISGSNQYATYKSSKGFGSVVVNIDELYHQFSFGIKKHPLSIRHFADFIVDTWNEAPSYLFLVGKSVKVNQHRKNAANFKLNQVPSFGNPASDNMLTAGLNQTNFNPLIPTGRLSAQTNAEVTDYLRKVTDFEMNTSEKWMKNILHFAGGTSSGESSRFVAYLAAFENILEDTAFGGNTVTFKKNTSAPIQISLSDSIRNLINGGTSLLTFFGHASTTGGFDQNIDDPENYNNKGKYPLLVGNSCFTGDIHESDAGSVSERFVLIKDKGVIAFLASVDLGFEDRLFDYSRSFFKSLGQVNYGKGFADHMQYAIKQTELKGTSYPYRSVAFLMTLHGDPSLVLNAHDLPDYVLTEKQVHTIPEVVTTVSDTFEVVMDVFNYGKAITDSVAIEVIRTYPDQTSESFNLKLPSIKFKRTATIKLPVDKLKGAGFNRLDISVDPSNLISELNESNNAISINFFIKSGDLIPVMPYEFAIIPEQDPILKASTGYAFEELTEYEFQLDTSDNFTNPLETYRVSSKGGVVTWNPTLLKSILDSAVYFWRTRNTNDINSIWRLSSFQYIKGKRGWSQDHFHQFKKDSYLFLEQNETPRRFTFSPSVKKLACQTSSTLNFSDLGDILYKLDADLQEYGGCGLGSAIHIAVLDSLTFQPWGTPFQGLNANHNFGQVNLNGNCGKPRVQNFFIFGSNSVSQLSGLKNMLVNEVPNGNYILAWTWVKNDFSNWDVIDPSLRQVFVNLGADTIDDITNDSLPYIFFVKKGHPETAKEVLGDTYDKFIYLTADLMNNSTYGGMTSTLIGPASAWDSLHWQHYSLENPSADSISLKMEGLAQDKKTVMASRTLKSDQKRNRISNLLSANSAPYMDLDAYMNDNLNQTAPQMDRWLVLYEGVTELALNANEHFEFYNDTLNEGEKLRFSTSVKNISEYPADSILIHYYIIDRNRNRIDLPYKRQKGLDPDSSFITSIEASTLGLRGNNTLVIEVNPNLDQVEQHYFNNVAQIPFIVSGDNTNPILDVTFDGIHILDGDIVSAKPEIAIQLTDENEYLILDDTSDFRIYLTYPNGQEKQRFFTNNDPNYNMVFIPADKNKNKASVELSPTLKEDGIYALRVQAKDRSNNESGNVDYRINFEVINRSTITKLLNYPNPFSTSTQFVFVLTGSKIPDNLQIQVITVSGKIVKTINMHELGPLRIGRNVTSYAWDGRDEYGDKLANGVYLYRVNTRLNGQTIEERSTTADKYFKQGFGKMVILR